MKIIIPGDPIPLARPRFSKRGGVYDCQKFDKRQVSWKMKLALREQNCTIIEHGAISVSINCTFLPSCPAQWMKNQYLWGYASHISRPDLDNLVKFVLDCGNGILWKDDAQICKLEAKKSYSNFPSTIIEFNEIKKITMTSDVEKVFKVFAPGDITELVDDFTPILESCEDDFLENREELFLPVLATRLVNFANKWAGKLKKVQNLES